MVDSCKKADQKVLADSREDKQHRPDFLGDMRLQSWQVDRELLLVADKKCILLSINQSIISSSIICFDTQGSSKILSMFVISGEFIEDLLLY